ncbi:ABC transporter permease [Yoonia vestfoldensis]|jgi:putative spermidine/putrescine transport system permease protein|uniref:Spermidine/putrescine transport system permease protein PotB n=1 Tax=Yoonia vestfoldensis TaxID=245188 RepID=A0A1Y0ECF5_9RHOB|nr:ABC transporter permease [Yoonia vestfoldensis]ARU01243.1 spermidine/putrescine transport system permease protein PotB [Yoonia vestfoldensis]
MAEQMMAADGRTLKSSLNRALRRQKLRALLLIAPLLLFILITFVIPIGQMLFRSVENQIVSDTIPRTVDALADWDAAADQLPDEDVFRAFAADMMVAVEERIHTRLGSRLNYETAGISSQFRRSGRDVEDMGEDLTAQFTALDPAWADPATWVALMADPDWIAARAGAATEPAFIVSESARAALPRSADVYADFARVTQQTNNDSPTEEQPWNVVYIALYEDLLADPAPRIAGAAPNDMLAAAGAAVAGFAAPDIRAAFVDSDRGWGETQTWQVIQTYSPAYTASYFLNAVDLKQTPEGIQSAPENQQIYVRLFIRTLIMSLTIMVSCILLGYPVAWMLANLPSRQANLMLILVLLPFWTSLLVRTSAWKVLLQQQGVINDLLVWVGLVADESRLTMINNATGTIIAMTHILLPFMILPLYSVMKTIPPSYLRAAKSLGATNWTAFWRVYFPQSVPGIGAGSILVFILSIGYYITPEIVGGTSGIFISNRIAYHISSSLNWGLAAALGTILLVVVLALYWAYDRIVGIDNVKLGG